MNTVTITRKSHLMLAARNFHILMDGKKVDTISDGETIEIALPDEPAALTVRVMHYESLPVIIGNGFPQHFTVKMNMISNILSTLLILTGVAFLSFSLLLEKQIPSWAWFILLPLLIAESYYFSFGRRKVLLVNESQNSL